MLVHHKVFLGRELGSKNRAPFVAKLLLKTASRNHLPESATPFSSCSNPNLHQYHKPSSSWWTGVDENIRRGSRGGPGADPGGGGAGGPGPPPPPPKKKEGRKGKERKEKKKKRGKRKRDIKKLRCHNLFFCAYIGLHWTGGRELPPQ